AKTSRSSTAVSAGTWRSRKMNRARVAVVPQKNVAAKTSQRGSRLRPRGRSEPAPVGSPAAATSEKPAPDERVGPFNRASAQGDRGASSRRTFQAAGDG